jgi:hypothetical protein
MIELIAGSPLFKLSQSEPQWSSEMETTHVYPEADLAAKEQALQKLAPVAEQEARTTVDDWINALSIANRQPKHDCRTSILCLVSQTGES